MGSYKVSQSTVVHVSGMFNASIHLHAKRVYLDSKKVFKESQVEDIYLVLNEQL